MPPASAPAPAACEHCEELETQLSSQVSARDLTIRDLRAQLTALRAAHDAAVADARREALEKAVRECERGTRLNDDGMLLLPTRDECIRRIRALAPSTSSPPAAFLSVPADHPDAVVPDFAPARLDADRTAQPKTEIRAAVAGHNGPVPWPGAPVAHVDLETGVRTDLATSAGNAGHGERDGEAETLIADAEEQASNFDPADEGAVLLRRLASWIRDARGRREGQR